jgi:purine-binding chemotaxis protein CheW
VTPEIAEPPLDGVIASMQNNKESREEAGASGDGTRKVLTFSLGGEVYGVDILRVKEIRGWSPVTRIPQTPASILGVLNLRGLIVPIVDLRVRFALKAAEFTPLTVIIVLSLRNVSGQRECGIVVDNVNDVVDIAADSIKPAPELGGGETGEYIEGITSHDEQMLILLNAESLAANQNSTIGVADQAA